MSTVRMDRVLIDKRMPDGYALIYDTDRRVFWWRRSDGVTGTAHQDKWHVWRDARSNAGVIKA